MKSLYVCRFLSVSGLCYVDCVHKVYSVVCVRVMSMHIKVCVECVW